MELRSLPSLDVNSFTIFLLSLNRIPPRNELCMHIFRGMGTGIVRKKWPLTYTLLEICWWCMGLVVTCTCMCLCVSFEKRSVWINPSFILILTSKNSICCEEKRNSVLIRGWSEYNLDRENLLQYNTKKQNNRVPLVITYSKALPNIHEILKKYMKILYNSASLDDLMLHASTCVCLCPLKRDLFG
jgi:hypothetical protein